LGQEAFPLNLTGTTNLGEYGGMIKRSKGGARTYLVILNGLTMKNSRVLTQTDTNKFTENITEKYTAPKTYKEITKVKNNINNNDTEKQIQPGRN
jgi:hypothetical protein